MTLMRKKEDALWLLDRMFRLYPKTAVFCSFGKDSMVILDLCRKINPKIPVVALLSDTEFDETYRFAREVVQLWDLNYTEIIFKQRDEVEKNPSTCCKEPKVKAAKKAVRDLDAWVAGVRTDEGAERRNVLPVDDGTGLVRINPILEFSENDVWRYLAIHQIPMNPVYQLGYRSLGCKICSTPEKNGKEPERKGRWNGTLQEGGECGIHVERLKGIDYAI